jgi:hypothetical protein
MPQFSAITLTDRDSTNHVFSPRQEEANDVFRYAKASASGVPIGESHLRVSLRETPSNFRVRLKLEVPIVATETVNGVDTPKVVRSGMVDTTFTFAKTSTTAERELLAGLMANALAAAQSDLDAVITDLQSIY